MNNANEVQTLTIHLNTFHRLPHMHSKYVAMHIVPADS